MGFDDISMVPRLINSAKIKYSVLDELFKDVKIEESTVNLYIDGYYIFYKLYKADYSVDIYKTNYDRFIRETVVSFLNTIAHYRRYIATRLHKSNRIFIINNRKTPKYQSDIIDGYGKSFYEKLYPTHFEYGVINRIIDQALVMAADLCQYFEDVFVVDGKKIEDHVTAAFLVPQYNGYNIFLSRNELFALLLDKHSCLIYPKRDDSVLMTADNYFIKTFRNVKYNPTYISAEYATFYFSLSGIKARNIPATCVRGSVRGAKVIDSMIEDKALSNHTSINTFISSLPKYLKRELSSEEQERITLLYKAINVRTALAALTESQTTRIYNSLVNLYDQTGLEELNKLVDRETDVLNLSDLNMNIVNDQHSSSWDWSQEWGFF